MRTFALFLSVACIAAEAWQAPVFQSETRLVLVDAVVTGKNGDYIRDLAAKDFRVWADNKEQTIRSFSAGADPSASEPGRVVLFFDNTGMSASDQTRVRQAAADFIDADATPNRQMAVVNYDGGYRVVQTFTGNADRLKAAVRGLKFAASDVAGPTAPGQGRFNGAQDAASARGLIQSGGNLARNLNALPGRKIVVLFTGAVSLATVAPDDAAGLVQICNRSNVAVYPVVQVAAQVPGDSSYGRVTAPASLAQAHGLDTAPGVRTDDTIPRMIAGGTGGFVVSGSDNLAARLQKIEAERSQSYVLGFIPPDAPPGSKDEPCYSLRVKVDRVGADVRSRVGYCAEKPKDLLAETRVERDLEKRAAGASTGSAASIQVPFFYISPNVARVHAAMEIATEALKFENQKGRLHAEIDILGIATAPDGGTAARFSDIVKRDFGSKEEVDIWREKPLYYEKEFRIVPGEYKLTVAFSSGGASFGKVETALRVPAYDGSQFAIGGLALSKQARPASELGLEASLIDDGTPLIADGVQIFPAGTNAFLKTEHVFGYFEIYMPDGAAPVNVSLHVVNSKTGASEWDSGIEKVGPAAEGKATVPVGMNVPIASLPSGAYRLEVTATGAGDRVARRSADIEIK